MSSIPTTAIAHRPLSSISLQRKEEYLLVCIKVDLGFDVIFGMEDMGAMINHLMAVFWPFCRSLTDERTDTILVAIGETPPRFA